MIPRKDVTEEETLKASSQTYPPRDLVHFDVAHDRRGLPPWYAEIEAEEAHNGSAHGELHHNLGAVTCRGSCVCHLSQTTHIRLVTLHIDVAPGRRGLS
jgi:hypothetical protein